LTLFAYLGGPVVLKNVIWRIVAVGVVLAWFSAAAKADDAKTAKPSSATVEKKPVCPKECERRARAALALAATAAPAVAAKPVAAPAPREKLCPCKDCKCQPGACPACPAAVGPVVVPAVMPAVTYREVWGYDARGRLVKWLEPCPNGKCPIPR
jgi:hypothetical protein